MPVSVYCQKNQSVSKEKLRRSLEALLQFAKMKNAHVEINLVGETRIQTLNRRYLKRDKATDVLSFPMEKNPSFPGVPWHLGEIFIATPVARRQAKKAGRSLEMQLLRLGVHGLVHLQGLDHDAGVKQRKLFEAREKRFLNFLNKKGFCRWDGSLLF